MPVHHDARPHLSPEQWGWPAPDWTLETLTQNNRVSSEWPRQESWPQGQNMATQQHLLPRPPWLSSVLTASSSKDASHPAQGHPGDLSLTYCVCKDFASAPGHSEVQGEDLASQ